MLDENVIFNFILFIPLVHMGQRPKPSPSEPAYAHKHTHSPPSIVHVRGEREATDFSRRSAGAAAGFPPLRRLLRRREGGETSVPVCT